MLIINQEDVFRALGMKEAVKAMKSAFIALSRREAVVPLRIHLDMAAHHGGALTMPVYLPSLNRLSVKVVTIHKDNPDRNLPMIHAVVNLFDADTGDMLAIINGESLTALRTGAASGLATDLLANPEAQTVALFGAGVQGKYQIEAVTSVRPIHKIYIYDPNASRRNEMIQWIQNVLQLDAAAGTPDGLKEADIVCTATSSRNPVFEDACLKADVHINGIGSYRPDMQEIPPETIKRSSLFVDSREACLAEAGDIVIPLQQRMISECHVQAEIGEVADGEHPGRRSADEVTVFKSVGNAVQDLAAASLIYDQAVEAGLGKQVEF